MKISEEFKTIKSTKKELREFGVTVGIFLLILAAFAWWRTRHFNLVLIGIGVGLSVLGALVPQILKPLQRVWMMLAVVIGFVMTRVLLSLLFLIAVIPIGILSRLTGKKFLDLEWKDGKSSYWILRKDQKRSENHWITQY